MKKFVLIALCIVFGYTSYSQDIIAGWTFPTGTEGDEYADQGLELNIGSRYIGAEDTVSYPDTNLREITYTSGASGEDTDFAATSTGWDTGESTKLWGIKIKTNGATNLTISSKQRAGGNNAGPRDFKIQYRIDSEWIDIANGVVTVANDWTTGVVEDLPLPAELDGETGSIFFRWIMTSNMDIDGNEITAEGIGKIDDILIKGTVETGIEEELTKDLRIFPNPVHSTLSISGINAFQKLEVMSITGKLVYHSDINLSETAVDVSDLAKGVYVLRLYAEQTNIAITRKFVVQ